MRSSSCGLTPRPTDAAPCGSKSTSRTLRPYSASAAPRLMVVVVLPTPPFWLHMAMMRPGPCAASEAGTGNSGRVRPTTSTRGSAAARSSGCATGRSAGGAASPSAEVCGTTGRTASPCEPCAPRVSGWVSAWLLTSATVSQDLAGAGAYAPARRVPGGRGAAVLAAVLGGALAPSRRGISPARGGAQPRRPRAACRASRACRSGSW
ncbi:Uncharacterised protein [Mycobacteroides abscessus]|nr:Uncharacterised protein [Mycobacteroides abscessus]